MTRTGESYTAALRVLRGLPEERTMSTTYQRIAKPALGFAVSLPDDWYQLPPGSEVSLNEVARFSAPDGRRWVIVYTQKLDSANKITPDVVAEMTRGVTEHSGDKDFVSATGLLGGHQAAVMATRGRPAGKVTR